MEMMKRFFCLNFMLCLLFGCMPVHSGNKAVPKIKAPPHQVIRPDNVNRSVIPAVEKWLLVGGGELIYFHDIVFYGYDFQNPENPGEGGSLITFRELNGLKVGEEIIAKAWGIALNPESGAVSDASGIQSVLKREDGSWFWGAPGKKIAWGPGETSYNFRLENGEDSYTRTFYSPYATSTD